MAESSTSLHCPECLCAWDLLATLHGNGSNSVKKLYPLFGLTFHCLAICIYRDVIHGVMILSLDVYSFRAMSLKKRNLQVLPNNQQESENHLTVHASGTLSIPWRFICRGSFVVGIVVLVIHLAPNVAGKLIFDGCIEWNPPDSTSCKGEDADDLNTEQ